MSPMISFVRDTDSGSRSDWWRTDCILSREGKSCHDDDQHNRHRC